LADPFGRVIARPRTIAEEIVLGEIDRLIERAPQLALLRDRRIEPMPITRRFSIRVTPGRRMEIPAKMPALTPLKVRRVNWAIVCPPNGSRTRLPGWHGRITRRLRKVPVHPWIYAEIVRLLARHELVHILAR